ncbi:LOW QUALITY PROTEIN: hypothetical protein ACHAWF_016068, partial [Thalassiosira exigua]
SHDPFKALFVKLVDVTRERSCLHPNVREIHHNSGALLDQMRHVGVSVPLSISLCIQLEKDVTATYGSHSSTRNHLDFRRSWILYGKDTGSCFLSGSFVRDMKDLRLAPMGCVPQRDFLPHLIVDYT